MKEPILSLCLPTNGITEWVFPTLDSIYGQGVNEALYEVIVTDNGKNEDFHNLMVDYADKHQNLIYKKTDAYMFDNQLEALKLASGLYFKLINHRGIFTPGALQHLISAVENNCEEKPVIYFSCGTRKKDIYYLTNFDEFVKTLGLYASWTTGVGIWKEDYERIPKDKNFDKISPHSQILFSERKKSSYIIDNYVFSQDITSDHGQKGTYDLFKAFAVEEFAITLNLFIDGDIRASTLKHVKKEYKWFISDLYLLFVVLRRPCSYDLAGFADSMDIFFRKKEIVMGAYLLAFKKVLEKIKRVVKNSNKYVGLI